MSGEVGRKHWGPGMTGADVLRAALHLALRPGPRCRSGRVGRPIRSTMHTLAGTQAVEVPESAKPPTDFRKSGEAHRLSGVRRTMRAMTLDKPEVDARRMEHRGPQARPSGGHRRGCRVLEHRLIFRVGEY